MWGIAKRSPEEALVRLVEHDSLHLHAATAARLRASRVLLDSERVFERACSRIAVAAAGMNGDMPPEESLVAWFHERIDEAVEDVLLKDSIALRDGLTCAEDISHYEFFVKTCMVVPENSLFVSVQFNGLPLECRETFFTLFIEHRSIAEALDAGLGPKDRLRLNAQRGVDAAAGINPRAPSWRDVADDTIGPWWAQDDAFDDDPEDSR